MSVKVEKAKEIASEFRNFFRFEHYLQEEHIKKAIQYLEADLANHGIGGSNNPQNNSRETSRVFIEIVDIFLPVYIEILEQSPMQYEYNQVQRTRQSILELLNKFIVVRNQQTNVRLYSLLLDIVRKDNEVNANCATKILHEFIKQLTDQINEQYAGINQKMNEYGIETMRQTYSTLMSQQAQQQREVSLQKQASNSAQNDSTAMQIEESSQNQGSNLDGNINGKQNNNSGSIKSNGDPNKYEDLLNVLIDIEKSYPMLEQLTDDVYKVICEKSKLISELSQNYKDPQFYIYKEQNTSSRKTQRQQNVQQQSQQVLSGSQSKVQQGQSQNDKIIPSLYSLQILSQLPHTFITIANLDLQPFCKLCVKFQQIKQQDKEEGLAAASVGSTPAIGEENNQASSNNASNPAPAGNNSQSSQKTYNFDNFSSGLVRQMKETIGNIIKGFVDVKIQEIYEELGKTATQELINALIKMIKFFFVLIKKNNDIQQRALFRNMNQQSFEQILDTDKVIECAINLIDKCPEEFYAQRIDTITNLRNLIMFKGGKLKLKYLHVLYSEQKIIGNTQLISIYGKNQIYNFFLEICKILNTEFSRLYMAVISQNPLRMNDVMPMLQIITNQVDNLLKNLFDNQLYIFMQERSLDQLKEVIRQFINIGNLKFVKEIKQFRHTIFMKIIQAIQLKYKEIKRNFQTIKRFMDNQEKSNNPLQKKKEENKGKKDEDLGEQMQIEEQFGEKQEQENSEKYQRDESRDKKISSLHLNQMPIVNLGDYDEPEWKKKRIDFIESNNVNIESNLQSLQFIQFYHLEIYNEKESLCFNGTKIKKNIDRQYIREIKNKIVDQLIELQREIQLQFFNENREDDFMVFSQKYKNASQQQIEQRKRQLSMHNALKDEQRIIFKKILKNGLEVFEVFHDYEHGNKQQDQQGQQNKKSHLLSFMQNFGLINDKITFKDIFEPNMDLIFKYLLKYNDCSENCMKNLITEPFIDTKQKQMQVPMPNNGTIENSHLAQILTTYLMHKLNTNIENIDPFSPFYEYRDKFFTLVQNIIKIPLRSFLRLQDYEFVYSYFRQIIIFLIKKAHTSQYPLEYLQILRTLFKSFLSSNIENQQVVNQLMNQFFSICNKSEEGSSSQSQQPYSSQNQQYAQQDSQYQNINILENLVALFDTDILEVKVIICELIQLLPLRIKHIVIKTKLLGRPLVKALSLLDQTNTTRTLKTIESILGYSTHDEIQSFFGDVKDELIEKLYEILYEQRIIEELRRKSYLYPDTHSIDKKIQNDPAIIVVKLLGRMNHLTRQNKFQEKLQSDIKNQEYLDQFFINIQMSTPNQEQLNLPLNDIILHSIDIFNKIIENFFCQTVRGNTTQSAFCILKIALFQFFPDSLFSKAAQNSSSSENHIQMNEMMDEKEMKSKQIFDNAFQINSSDDRIQDKEGLLDKILKIFFEIVGIDQKLTTSYSVINRFKKESQHILDVLNKTVSSLYKANKEESSKYLKALTLNGIRSVKMKVILTREELHLCKEQICGQIQFIQKFFKNQQEYLKDADKNSYTEFQEFYLKSILKELLNTTNQNKIYGLQVILLDFIEEYISDTTLLQNQQSCVIEVINTIFIILNELPDIINLKTTKVSSQILAKILKFFRKHKDSFEKTSCKNIISIFFNNLLTCREFAHSLAKDCLINISQILKKNLIELFYWKIDTPEFEDSPLNSQIQDSPYMTSSSSSGHQQSQQSGISQNALSSYIYNTTQFPIGRIIDGMQNTFLGSLLSKIKTSIQNFSLNNNNFENMKQMKYLSNVYKSLEFLICADQNRLPFRVMINDPPKNMSSEEQASNFPEKYYKFDPDIVNIIQSSDIIISTNTEKMSKHVKIIIENTKSPNQPTQAAGAAVPSSGPKLPEATSSAQASTTATTPAGQVRSSSTQPTAGSNLATAGATSNNSASTAPTGQSGQRPSNAVNPIQNAFQINHQVYLNIEEFDLNIEDIDLRMKEQSNLIQSILSFLKSLLLLQPVKKVAKNNLKHREKNQQDTSEILSYRYKIILKLFTQMTRIERGISGTSQSCLSEMINQESHPKELLNNEEKLKSILKPVLMCLSNQFSTFTPSFLQVLKKILKLLTPCFNKALSDKLTNHLDEVTKDLNIKFNVQCISGLLKLFQYLQYAYQTAYNNNNQASKQKEYIKKSIDTIITNINKIEQSYAQTEGKYQIQQITRKSLCKFMNSMSAQVTENYFTETDPEILNLLLEILKLNKAMVVRERLTRDGNQSVIYKLYNKGREKENKIVFLRIIKNLGNKNCRLMLNNQQGVECIKERFSEIIKIQRDKAITDTSVLSNQSTSTKNEIIYYLKILIIYCQQKHTDVETLFNLADFLNIRMARYTYFVQDFFNYYLPYHYSVEQKKIIFEKFMDYTLQNLEKKEKIETIINISYHIIYPMLVHSNKLGQVSQIVDKKKYVEFFSQFNIPKLMFAYFRLEIEILQLSTLLLSYMRSEISQLKKQFVQFGWKYMKTDDKLLKQFGYVYTCQFIRLFGMPDDMIFTIYASLINRRQDDIVVQQENEIGALIKKALNFLIPFLTQNNSQSKQFDWVKLTTNIFQDDSNQKHASCIRFWQIFIKNHRIFQQYRKQFSPHMINSTQQLILQATKQNHNTQNNRIAWDLTFLYIEWAFIEMKQILNGAEAYGRQKKLNQLIEQAKESQAILSQDGGQTPKFSIEEDENINNTEFIKKIASQQLISNQTGNQEQIEARGEPISFSRSMQQNPEQQDNSNSAYEQDSHTSNGNNKLNDLSYQQQRDAMQKYNIKEEDIILTSEEILEAKVVLIDKFSEEIDQGAKQVIVPFFIKLISNILQNQERDRDEKNFIKRTFYLLKKTFFIWPNSVMKHDYYKKELSRFSNKSNFFYFCQLSILSIILEFESNEKILNFLPIVYKLLDNKPNQSTQPQQSGPTPQAPNTSAGSEQNQSQGQNNQALQNQQQFSLLQIENPYIILVISTIFKRLLNVSSIYKENEQASEFFRNVQHLVKESIEQHVKYIHASNSIRHTPQQQIPANTQANLNQIKQSQPMSIQLSIKLLKTLYQLDDKADLGLRNIKNLVQFMLDKVKMCKSPQDGYYLLTFNSEYESDIANKIIKVNTKTTQSKNVIQEYSEEFEETLLYCDEAYESTKINNIHNKQNFITLLRTLALKINSFNDKDNQDITAILKMLASYLEKIYDLDIRIESVNLLKCLMIGEKAFKDNVIPPHYSKIKLVNLSAEKKMEQIINIFNYIARVFDKRFGLTNLQLRLTNTNPDIAAECMSLKIAEENIIQEFMNFLVYAIKESGINKIDSDYIRYLLLLFCKNSSSKDLALFLQLAGDLFCTSDFNSLQMIFGQFQSDRCLKKIQTVVINPMSKEVSLENLEQDEVFLLGFKLILFKIIDFASHVKIKFQSDNFDTNELSNTRIVTLSTETQDNYKEFFELRDYALNKREIIELYADMMTSAQIKQSPINSSDQTTNNYTFVLYQSQVSFSCPITPHLLIPAFKKVFNFMIQLNPKPILLRQQAMQLFEQSILRLNTFPQYFSNQKQYISMYLVQALTEILLEELKNPTGYIVYPEKLQTTCREYNIWSQVQIYLERMHFQRDKYIDQFKQYPLKNFETSSVLDQLSQIIDETNESDYSYGLKYYMSNNSYLKRAIAIQQQREWTDAQNYLVEYQGHMFNDNQAKFSKENASYYSFLEDYSHIMDQSIYKILFVETQKNLNKWDELYEYSEKTQNIFLQLTIILLAKELECMYNTSNITGMKKWIQRCLDIGLSMETAFRYHCTSLIEFQRTTERDESHVKQDQNYNLSMAYFQTLKDWTKFPKIFSAVHLKHSSQLQSLIELEEGFRVRENREQSQVTHPTIQIESLSKGTQMMFNQWRERMPHKYENLTTWKNIIEQRNIILTSISCRLKDRFKGFLLKVQSYNQQRRATLASQTPGGPEGSNSNQNPSQPNASSSSSSSQQLENYVQQILDNDRIDKILAPFSDHRWNILKYLRIQKLFGNNSIEKMPNFDSRLHPEEVYLRAKLIASIYKENESINSLKSAIETLEKITSKDQEEFKVHKADLLRKRALLYWQNDKYLESTEDMQKSILMCDTYYKTWKSWLDICFSNYLKRKNSEYWVRNCMQLIPQALKYKSYKSQMLFSYAFFIMNLDQQFFIENMKQIHQELPKPQLLMWVPYMLSLIQNNSPPEIIDIFTKIINELAIIYPQYIFYYLRGLLDLSSSSQTLSGAQFNNTQILSIYNSLRTCQNSALVKKLETFADVIAQQYYQSQPQFEFEYSLNEINQLVEEYSTLNINSNIQGYYQKIIHFLNQVQSYSFFHPQIIEANEASAFVSELNQESIKPNQAITFLREKIYNPMLRYYVKNYVLEQNPSMSFSSEQLLSLSQNSQEIELPGQYKIEANTPVFRDFEPSAHTTVLSVNKSLVVGFKNRKIQKQIVINASNNKQFIYEILDARQDGDQCSTFQQNQLKLFVIQQMQDIMNILFNLHKETNIRHMNIKNPQKFSLQMREESKVSSVFKKNMQIMITPRAPNVLSLQDIHDQFLIGEQIGIQDKFNSHLDNYNLDNQVEVNQIMKNTVSNSVLYDYVLSKITDLNDYIYIRKELSYYYSSAMFFNYFIGQSIKISDISFDISKGTVYCNTSNVEINSNNKLVIKNPHSIRLSRNVITYIGELGILGIVSPTFISMAKAVTQPKYPIKEICMLFLNEIYMSVGIKESMASDQFGEHLKKIYEKLYWLYVEDISRTWSSASSQQFQESQSNDNENPMQNENTNKENPVLSKTNNGFMDPIYPRAYSIMETIEQSQLNNNNNLVYKYWF